MAVSLQTNYFGLCATAKGYCVLIQGVDIQGHRLWTLLLPQWSKQKWLLEINISTYGQEIALYSEGNPYEHSVLFSSCLKCNKPSQYAISASLKLLMVTCEDRWVIRSPCLVEGIVTFHSDHQRVVRPAGAFCWWLQSYFRCLGVGFEINF
jgi:hypothetical protein